MPDFTPMRPSNWKSRPFLRLTILSALLASSCKSPPARLPPAEISYWRGDGVPGAPSVVINLTSQLAHFYKDNTLVGVSQISTGREGLDTIRGKFRIIEKDQVHASSLFGSYVDSRGTVIKVDVNTRTDTPPPGSHYVGASMPYWMRIVRGTGMHAGHLPGYPASHGCIRMPE
jgi:hypothetical protein